MNDTTTPVEDYLDNLLRRSRSDARTTRRLVDEAADHLHGATEDLVAGGLSRVDAEREAVRRFGPADPLLRAARRNSLRALVAESVRAVVVLGAVGLVAVGLSGVVAAVMNLAFGDAFVGGTTGLSTRHASVDEAAADAVSLRVLAGLVGLAVLAGAYLVRRHHRAASAVLPAGTLDLLAVAAFGGGAAALGAASVDQLVRHGAHGVGFFLSGAVVALACALWACVRAVRTLTGPTRPAVMAS